MPKEHFEIPVLNVFLVRRVDRRLASEQLLLLVVPPGQGAPDRVTWGSEEMLFDLLRQHVPARGRGALREVALLDGVADVVEVNDAPTEDSVEAEHGQPAVVPDADLQPPVSQLGLVEAVLEGLLENGTGRLALRLGLPLRVWKSPVRT